MNRRLFCSLQVAAVLTSCCRFASTLSFYDRLGVSRDASTDVIKQKFRERALQCHPDAQPAERKTRAETEFRQVAEAYETLGDPAKRRKYDATLQLDDEDADVARASSRRAASPRRRQSQARRQANRKSPPRRSTSSSSASASSSAARAARGTATAAAQQRTKSPFLSKDAARIFREVFGGKSVHDILFSNAFDKKFGNTPASPGTGDGAASSSASAQAEQQQWQQLMSRSKAELHKQFKAKFPFANPRDVRVGIRAGVLAPDAPPSDTFPFRRCPGLNFPDGVVSDGYEVEPLTAAKAAKPVAPADIVHVSQEPMTSYADGETRRGAKAYEDGLDPEAMADALATSTRKPTLRDGMLYSFRRQY